MGKIQRDMLWRYVYKCAQGRRNKGTPLDFQIHKLEPISTNENKEVLVYDHFDGDNSCLKFIINYLPPFLIPTLWKMGILHHK